MVEPTDSWSDSIKRNLCSVGWLSGEGKNPPEWYCAQDIFVYFHWS